MNDVAVKNLLAGEQVIWAGRPYGGIILRPSEVFLIPFSLVWGGFALFWNVSVWMAEAGTEFRIFGIPFLIVGLYATVGRFLIDARVRTNCRCQRKLAPFCQR